MDAPRRFVVELALRLSQWERENSTAIGIFNPRDAFVNHLELYSRQRQWNSINNNRPAQTMLRSSLSSRRFLVSAVSTNSRRATQSLLFHRPWSASAQRLASSSSTTKKPSSWRGTFVRWGLALGVVYFYSTSSIFTEHPQRKLMPCK
jgi:hypothetical protein